MRFRIRKRLFACAFGGSGFRGSDWRCEGVGGTSTEGVGGIKEGWHEDRSVTERKRIKAG